MIIIIYIRYFPSFRQDSIVSPSGVSLAITLSHTSSAPSFLHVSSQLRIHSPSPHPYEPNSAIFLPDNPLTSALNIGSNSDSSSCSAPIEGEPKANQSKSLSISGVKSDGVNKMPSPPADFTPSITAFSISSVLPVPLQKTIAILLITLIPSFII